MKKKIVHIITYILFILFALIIIFPLIWMVITGFKTNQELFLSPFSLPETWHWENYVNAWNKGIGVYLSNSVIITVAATALSTFLSSSIFFTIEDKRLSIFSAYITASYPDFFKILCIFRVSLLTASP